MIQLTNVSKIYSTKSGPRCILNKINLQIEKREKIGIIGRNGSGKSTLIRILSGSELPTTGKVDRSMSVSWPLAFTGGFQGSLSGKDNLRFICRIYNVQFKPAFQFVQHFSELGRYLDEPVKTYSSGMRARLGFAISMAVDFDCFLIDEVLAVGDMGFRKKCEYELFENRKEKTFIFVSHEADTIYQYCRTVILLENGSLFRLNTKEETLARYESQFRS
jgi:capsular polysaccharide transport system ATP-binding protein